MTGFVQHAAVGRHPLFKQVDVGHIALAHTSGQIPRRLDVTDADIHAQITLQAQPVVPTVAVQPVKQRRRWIKTVGQQHHRCPSR
jgi:hypothetical protein